MPIALTIAKLLSKVWFVTLCKEEVFYTTDVIGRYTEVYNTVKSNDALLKPNDKFAALSIDVETQTTTKNVPQQQPTTPKRPAVLKSMTLQIAAEPAAMSVADSHNDSAIVSPVPPKRPTRRPAAGDKSLADNDNAVELMTLADEENDRFSVNTSNADATLVTSPTCMMSVQSPNSVYGGYASTVGQDLQRAQSTRSDC
eukprot:UN04605